MSEYDYNEFAMYLTGVAMTFDKTIRAEQIDLYFEILKDEFVNINEFKEVAKKVMKTWSYSYMPKPAHFLENKKEDKFEVEAIANKSWELVVEAIENGAGYTSVPKFNDKILEYVVSLIGGFYTLRQLDYKQLEFKKKDYIKLYVNYYNKENISIPKITHKTTLETPVIKEYKADYKIKTLKSDNLIENKQSEFNKKLGLSFKRI